MMSTDKVDNLVEKFDNRSDGSVEKFIDNCYYYLAHISMIYMKTDKKHRLLSILQFIISFAILLFHFSLLMRTSFFWLDINFIVFVHNTHIGILTFLVIVVVIDYQWHRDAFYHLHQLVATDFYDYHEPEMEAVSKYRKDMMRQRRRLALIPISVCVSGCAVLTLANPLDRLGTFDFSKTEGIVSENLPYGFGVYPYNTKDGPGYYISNILQVMLVLILGAPAGTTGWMYIVLTQNIILQLKRLMESLKNLEERSKNMCERIFHRRFDGSSQITFDSEEFIYCYNKCLNKNIEHHQIILSGFYSLKELFSVAVFMSYMGGTLVIALSLLSSGSGIELPGTAITAVLFGFAEVGYMYLFSVFSQYIIDMSTELRFTMYDIKWYNGNKSIAQSIAIFQTITLKPMTMTAGGIVPINMDTFGNVMNSAYSYYNVVNAFNISL